MADRWTLSEHHVDLRRPQPTIYNVRWVYGFTTTSVDLRGALTTPPT